MNKSSNTKSRAAYTPNMDMPSRKKGNRALLALVLTVVFPPLGLVYMWREGIFRTRGRMVLSALATIEMAIFFVLIMPANELSSQAPVPVAPVAATIAPDDGVVSALSNLDQLLAARQAELDAASGVTPEPTFDPAAREAEKQAILQTTVYSVFGNSAKYYHKDTVCGTQSNRRALTVQEAMGEGMGVCPDCNPPSLSGF